MNKDPSTQTCACACAQSERNVLHQRALEAMRGMQEGQHYLTIQLKVFTLEEVMTLVTAVLDGEPNPQKLARVVWEMTAGWPLYAEQASSSDNFVYTVYISWVFSS